MQYLSPKKIMPYDREKDQYYWGYSPQPDGTGYNPNAPSPKLSDAYRVLKNHVASVTKSRIQIAVVGKLYKGKGKYTGLTGTVTFGSFEATATGGGLTGKAVKQGGGGFSLEQKIAALLGLKEVPEEITGIYFRILD